MFIKQLVLKNFRCFADTTFTIDNKIVLIEGLNGTGKTSLLEALHYLCYLRSFRTHTPRELLNFGQATFFIKAVCTNDFLQQHEVQVGFSAKKRLVKVDEKAVSSYRELMDFYRVITLTQEDMVLIQGGPEVRRAFIDQAILLYNPEFAQKMRDLRTVLDNRNLFLQRASADKAYQLVLTQQLWAMSQDIATTRMQALAGMEKVANALLKTYFDNDLTVDLIYQAKKIEFNVDFEQFYTQNSSLWADEQRYGRSLFGAHLDDFAIQFKDKRSKSFASRGQQKLIVLLIKIAQIKELMAKKGQAIFMLDDFMTDFDVQRSQAALKALMDLDSQLIFTAPARAGILEEQLRAQGVQTILLTP